MNAAPRRPDTRPRLAMLLTIVLAGFAATPASAQKPDDGGAIAGRVVDAGSGVPVPGARVALIARDRGTFTDAQGRFTLRDLRHGTHAVTVTQLGYDSLATNIAFSEGTGSVVLRLSPNPVILEGVQVVSDRLRSRRNAVATSVQAFDQRALQLSGARDALDFIRTRTLLTLAPCLDRASVDACAYVRGRPTPVRVTIDDVPVFGGLNYLDSYRPEEIYLVEVYRGGSHLRVYTNWYMEWTAKSGRRPAPVLFW